MNLALSGFYKSLWFSLTIACRCDDVSTPTVSHTMDERKLMDIYGQREVSARNVKLDSDFHFTLGTKIK